LSDIWRLASAFRSGSRANRRHSRSIERRAGLDRRVDLLVGAGVRLVASFDAESLGLDRTRDREAMSRARCRARSRAGKIAESAEA
jgi:hypothetical protein